MRKIFVILLALLLIGGNALAEPFETDGYAIDPANPPAIDLDGDGAAETVTFEMVPDEYDNYLQIQVTTSEGATLTYDTGIIYGEGAWACDMDGDGIVEIFAWGDVMSDDYYTWCVQYTGRILKPVLFADVERGSVNGPGYYKWGYGQLTDADPAAGTVTLCGSQDVLGTYFMCRTLRLEEDGLFEYGDDGWWRRDVSAMLDDADSWEYGALTLKAAVPCEVGGAADTLNPGDQIIITGTDKETKASFIARDGREGMLAISEDYERGWGMLVDGVPEGDLFEFVPYAD